MIKIDSNTLETGERVLVLEGDFGLAESEQIKARLLALMEDTTESILIDLTGTDYLNEECIGQIIGAHKLLQTEGRRLIIICPKDGQPRRSLEMKGLESYLNVFTSAAEYLREEGVKS
jgi:anti-anti-sigma factor